MKRGVCVTFFLLFVKFLSAQNLVPNTDFEKYSPGDNPQGSSKGYVCDNWFSPTDGTPDFFIKWSRREKDMDNWAGFKLARSGQCYYGIITRYIFDFTGRGNYREYISTKLKKPLVKGQKYQVKFYVIKARNAMYATDGFAVYFSKNKIDTTGYDGYLNVYPQITTVDMGVILETEHWTKIKDEYTAEGGEKYITIGNFNSNFNTMWVELHDIDPYNRYFCAYYYIDDVSVIPVNYYENDLNIGAINVLDNIYFKAGQSQLLSGSIEELNKLFTLLKEYPALEIEIAGHTDNTGYEDHNRKLSYERAKAVAEYLFRQGISRSRIDCKGYGSSKPVADNSTLKGRNKNRRVEFKVVNLK
jgi:OmpA-OmpF porin, OOP family